MAGAGTGDARDQDHAPRFRRGEGPGAAVTFLLLPGPDGDSDALVDLARGLADEANLLCPDGLPGPDGDVPGRQPIESNGWVDPDPAGDADRLLAAVEHAAANHGFDRRRVVAIAVAEGGGRAVELLCRHPGSLRGAVLFQPVMAALPQPSPALAALPVLIAAGREDPHMTPAATLRLAEQLLDAGAAVTLSWHAGGAARNEASFRAARTWLRLTRLVDQR